MAVMSSKKALGLMFPGATVNPLAPSPSYSPSPTVSPQLSPTAARLSPTVQPAISPVALPTGSGLLSSSVALLPRTAAITPAPLAPSITSAVLSPAPTIATVAPAGSILIPRTSAIAIPTATPTVQAGATASFTAPEAPKSQAVVQQPPPPPPPVFRQPTILAPPPTPEQTRRTPGQFAPPSQQTIDVSPSATVDIPRTSAVRDLQAEPSGEAATGFRPVTESSSGGGGGGDAGDDTAAQIEEAKKQLESALKGVNPMFMLGGAIAGFVVAGRTGAIAGGVIGGVLGRKKNG